MLDDGVVEQGLEQRGAFSIGDAPGDDPAAENIDDDIEIEVAPFRGPHQLGYVPGPNLIWAFGEKFRLLIDGAPQLSTPFADFVMLGENAIHGADRAQIDALVEQAGVDFAGAKSTNRGSLNRSSTTWRSFATSARIGVGRGRTVASGCLRKA